MTRRQWSGQSGEIERRFASKNKVKQNLKQSKGCACETPLAEVFFFPGNGARKMS
jgi:hypothetical protein